MQNLATRLDRRPSADGGPDGSEGEQVTLHRPSSLPGVELWTVRRSIRPWPAFHTTYLFCTPERLDNQPLWRCRGVTHKLGPTSTHPCWSPASCTWRRTSPPRRTCTSCWSRPRWSGRPVDETVGGPVSSPGSCFPPAPGGRPGPGGGVRSAAPGAGAPGRPTPWSSGTTSSCYLRALMERAGQADLPVPAEATTRCLQGGRAGADGGRGAVRRAADPG